MAQSALEFRALEKSKMAGAKLQPQLCRNISVEDVFSTEELLTEILERVPAKPLIRFKCVSKHWLSLISNPKFCHNHTLQNPNAPVSAVLRPDSKPFSYIYLSEDRTWRLLDSIFEVGNNHIVDYSEGVYWNGAVHWIGRFAKLTYYHIEQDLVRNIEHDREKLFDTHREKRGVYQCFKESADGGYLHLIEIYGTNICTEFKVLEMGKDYGGWIVKYNVDLGPLFDRFSRIDLGYVYGLFVDGSTLFLHSKGLFISCDLKRNTFKCFKLNNGHRGYLVDPRNYMYKETLASVW